MRFESYETGKKRKKSELHSVESPKSLCFPRGEGGRKIASLCADLKLLDRSSLFLPLRIREEEKRTVERYITYNNVFFDTIKRDNIEKL